MYISENFITTVVISVAVAWFVLPPIVCGLIRLFDPEWTHKPTKEEKWEK
jgi:hypothetical protein